MIESAAYEMIKQEGFQQGVQQGIQQGAQQGALNASKDNVIELLIERFELVPTQLVTLIHQVDNLLTLKMLLKKAMKTPSLDEFKSDLTRLLQ